MVSVRPLSNGCTQELGVRGDSPKQLPNYIYNSTDTYHEPTDKWQWFLYDYIFREITVTRKQRQQERK